MTTAREDFLDMVDDLRSLIGPDDPGFDIQTVKVKIVQRSWSGGRRGVGALSESTLSDLPQWFPVLHVSAREVAGSGGRYEMEDQKVGPITPALSFTVTDASNASPVVLEFDREHNLTSGDHVTVSGVLGNTGANVAAPVTVVDTTHVSLDGSSGTGAYESGGSARVVGFTPDELKPAGETGTEIVYVLTGTVTGDFELVELHTEMAFSYFMVLRRMRTTP